MVEQGIENSRVVGSIPTGGTPIVGNHDRQYADLAHLVERNLAKVEVAGSSPVIRLKQYRKVLLFVFAFLYFCWGEVWRAAGFFDFKLGV